MIDHERAAAARKSTAMAKKFRRALNTNGFHFVNNDELPSIRNFVEVPWKSLIVLQRIGYIHFYEAMSSIPPPKKRKKKRPVTFLDHPGRSEVVVVLVE